MIGFVWVLTTSERQFLKQNRSPTKHLKGPIYDVIKVMNATIISVYCFITNILFHFSLIYSINTFYAVLMGQRNILYSLESFFVKFGSKIVDADNVKLLNMIKFHLILKFIHHLSGTYINTLITVFYLSLARV